MKKFLIMMSALVAMIGVAKAEEIVVTVDISDQIMVIQTPYETFAWNVSTARKGYHTPRGMFQPYLLKKMHYSSKYDNAPMPNSIFFHGGYAIHATEDLKRLGRPASHGCIRLHPQNAKWLYRLVNEYGMENTFIVVQD
jgi:lipoprotein-anchoring transpeptidase ErfK/SrfK